MREGNTSQAGSLESILDGAKWILGCNEAVRGDMSLDTLQRRRDRAKLKWWYKLATLPEDRYPKQLFNQERNIKPHRRRQRKVLSRMVNKLQSWNMPCSTLNASNFPPLNIPHF